VAGIGETGPFPGSALGNAVFQRVAGIVDRFRGVEVRVNNRRDFVTFVRARTFASILVPSPEFTSRRDIQLAIDFSRPHGSDRFAAVQGQDDDWSHHLWVSDPIEIDDQVGDWLADAYVEAAEPRRVDPAADLTPEQRASVERILRDQGLSRAWLVLIPGDTTELVILAPGDELAHIDRTPVELAVMKVLPRKVWLLPFDATATVGELYF